MLLSKEIHKRQEQTRINSAVEGRPGGRNSHSEPWVFTAQKTGSSYEGFESSGHVKETQGIKPKQKISILLEWHCFGIP